MIAIGAISVSSCGIMSNSTANVNSVQTEVVLSQSSYEVVGTVTAKSSQTYVFGIGGMSKIALESNAVSQLSEKANLKGSQAIVNVATQIQLKMVTPIFIKRTVFARGTIVEFK